jgi:hypothetical protein
MIEERRKLVLSLLVYTGIIALVAFILFHQSTVKQRLTESLVQRPQSSSASLFTVGAFLPSSPIFEACGEHEAGWRVQH